MTSSFAPSKPPSRPKAAFVLEKENAEVIYGPEEREEISRLVDLVGPPMGAQELAHNRAALREVEVILSGWGAPLMDRAFLDNAPKLNAVFYGAGSVRYFLSPEFWERGIALSSAYAANAVPVAEYTLGVILLSLKRFWNFAAQTKEGRGWGDHRRHVPGAFRSTLGLVSFGMIARRLLELLKPTDLRILVYCPYLDPREAKDLGVEPAPLDRIFRDADVVSIHTPLLPETEGMINRPLLTSMKAEATLINTARGKIINQADLIEVLQGRPDLTAVLDVCTPEPPPIDSPLLRLPNLILTPHIAGSHGPECHRLGAYAVAELRRHLHGEPLRWRITAEMVSKMA